MTVEIPVTRDATVKMKISDVLYFEKQKDEEKKVGIVVSFSGNTDDMEVLLEMNIADENLNVTDE